MASTDPVSHLEKGALTEESALFGEPLQACRVGEEPTKLESQPRRDERAGDLKPPLALSVHVDRRK